MNPGFLKFFIISDAELLNVGACLTLFLSVSQPAAAAEKKSASAEAGKEVVPPKEVSPVRPVRGDKPAHEEAAGLNPLINTVGVVLHS